MIEFGPLKLENQVKKSLFCVASPHLPQLGEGALQDHLEGKDPEMLVLSVLMGQDHSGDFRLSPRFPEDIILQLMHSIRHLLPLCLWP